jgi:hypothetical protein
MRQENKNDYMKDSVNDERQILFHVYPKYHTKIC